MSTTPTGDGGASAQSAEQALRALERAYVERSYGYRDDADIIALAVEFARAGGPLADDPDLMALACLDARFPEERHRALGALHAALEARAPGWALTTHGEAIALDLLDGEARRYLQPGNSVGRLVGLVNALIEDFGARPWLGPFAPDGAETRLDLLDELAEDTEWLRQACAGYLAWREHPSRSDQPGQPRARPRQTDADRELELAYEEFETARRAHGAGEPGAETHFRSALAAFERRLPDSRWLATARNELGVVLKEKGRPRDAAALFRMAHEYFEARHPEDEPDVAVTLHNLGAALSQLGDAKAAGYLERALQLQLTHGRTRPIDIANNWQTLGENQHARGLLREARSSFEQGLAILDRMPERPLKAIGDACAHLCEVTQELGDLAAAESYARRLVAARTEALGPFHRDAADSLNALATVLHSQGRLREAEETLRLALGRFEEGPGRYDAYAINTRINLAQVLHWRGDADSADRTVREALEASEHAEGRDSARTARALSVLGEILNDRGLHGDAVPVLTRARDIYVRERGPDHVDTAYCMNRLGLAFRGCGALAEAVNMHEHAEAVLARRRGPDHVDTLTARSNRAVALEMQGRAQDAEAVWADVVARSARIAGAQALKGEAAYRMAESLRARGELAAARGRYLEALEAFEGRDDTANPGIICEALARLHASAGEFDRAEHYLGRVPPIYARVYGRLHEETIRVGSEFVEVLARRDVPAAARIASDRLAAVRKHREAPADMLARLSLQAGRLLRRAGDARQARSLLQEAHLSILRSGALRPDAETAIDVAFELAGAHAEVKDGASRVGTLRRALGRCDELPDADEGSVAALCLALALALVDGGDREQAHVAAVRAWSYFRSARGDPDAAASAFTAYWQTAPERDVRPAAWCAHLEAGGASATWRLLLEFSTEDGRELDCILGALGEHIPAEFERVGSRLTLSSPPCAPLDAQTDLVHALAAYPRLSWARWTIWCDAGTGEAMRAQGTDASDLLAIVRAPR